jgi:hypothetical protein
MGYLRRPRARVLASRPSFARARLAIDPRARLARPLAPPPVVVGAVDERTRRRLATRDARDTRTTRAAPERRACEYGLFYVTSTHTIAIERYVVIASCCEINHRAVAAGAARYGASASARWRRRAPPGARSAISAS